VSQAGAPAVAAVDWGTSSLRVWLLDSGGAVLAERRSGEGMQTARETGFAPVLERMLSELAAPDALPAIVCGMAGARQGWVEAPYADVPSPLDDIFARAITVPGIARQVRIVPGLAQRLAGPPDVMRGEETQIAGAVGGLGKGRHVLCMPGTHSKWAEIADGSVTRFTSWMTGEVFGVFAAHSILVHSVGAEAGNVDPASPAFGEGVATGLAEPDRVTSLIFGIRAASLLEGLGHRDAAARLSGLLIGAEIAAAGARYLENGAPVVLVASGGLKTAYGKALAQAGLSVRAVDADEAVRAGLVHAARVNGFLPEV